MNPCAGYDFRMNADGLDHDLIEKQLRKLCKKWTFQLEEGEKTGYRHYQGRMSLKVKHRKCELMKMFDLIPVPNYLEPTVGGVFVTGDNFYVTKDETRVAGPWTDKDEKKYIPRHYRGIIDKMYPFQKQIYDSASVFDSRIINLIYCPEGNKGKSTIAAICELYGNGIDLPPVNDADKLIQSCCDICMAREIRNPSPIFVDLPRAMSKDRLFGVYTAIEQIKKGKLYDMRHHYKEWWIDSPQIWVFSNIMPELNLLSLDRWKLWTINDKNELETLQE